MFGTRRILIGALVLIMLLLGIGTMSASAYSAGSGDQAFLHRTAYYGGGGATAFYFTSHSNAQSQWDYDGSSKRVYSHYMGTTVTNGWSYPFPIDVTGPHIYYSTSQYYFDLTSGYFGQATVMCNTGDVCEGFTSSQTFWMNNASVSAKLDIWIGTGAQTSPVSHQDDLSPYSF